MLSGLFSDLRQLAHPILVHFPIALLLASVALDWLGYLLARPGFTRAGFYTLVLGALGAGVAALAGPDHVDGAEAAALLSWHQLFALLTVALAVALVAIRFFSTYGLTGARALGYLAATVALVAAVSLTGYFGGELTYHMGVGVANSGAASDSLAAIAAAPHVPAKPLIALIGFLCLVGLGVWLTAGRTLAPRYYATWWQAVRRVGIDNIPLWTVWRIAPRPIAAPPTTPPQYGPPNYGPRNQPSNDGPLNQPPRYRPSDQPSGYEPSGYGPQRP